MDAALGTYIVPPKLSSFDPTILICVVHFRSYRFRLNFVRASSCYLTLFSVEQQIRVKYLKKKKKKSKIAKSQAERKIRKKNRDPKCRVHTLEWCLGRLIFDGASPIKNPHLTLPYGGQQTGSKMYFFVFVLSFINYKFFSYHLFIDKKKFFHRLLNSSSTNVSCTRSLRTRTDRCGFDVSSCGCERAAAPIVNVIVSSFDGVSEFIYARIYVWSGLLMSVQIRHRMLSECRICAHHIEFNLVQQLSAILD